MKKLEPGMLCRVVGVKDPRNVGKVVKLVRLVGGPLKVDGIHGRWPAGECWEVNEDLLVSNCIGEEAWAPYAPPENLQPINPDHQPADEQWQADFKRMLNGEKLRVKP